VQVLAECCRYHAIQQWPRCYQTQEDTMTESQIAALGATMAAEEVRKADAQLDDDGTPLWPAEPLEEHWLRLESHMDTWATA
jgi:hypothetical protein